MALFKAAGRAPLVGLAAVFAGVSAGFSANLLLTGLEPLLAGFSTSAARILDPEYEVAATANLRFIQVSSKVAPQSRQCTGLRRTVFTVSLSWSMPGETSL